MLSNAASFESFKDRPKSFFSMAVLRARTDSLGSKTRRKQKELNCQIIAMVCECVCDIMIFMKCHTNRIKIEMNRAVCCLCRGNIIIFGNVSNSNQNTFIYWT